MPDAISIFDIIRSVKCWTKKRRTDSKSKPHSGSKKTRADSKSKPHSGSRETRADSKSKPHNGSKK
jgi:hypothetical protein